MNFPAAVLELARSVRLLILDVDGVLTDGRLYYGADGERLKAFSTQDGAAIKMLQQGNVQIAIISGRTSSAVEWRARELGIQHLYQGAADKRDALDALAQASGIAPGAMAHAGDDIPDLPLFARVGVAFAPANAHPVVAAAADYTTGAAGGHGAVREICQLILTAHGAWEALLTRARR